MLFRSQGDPTISGSVVVWTDQRYGNDDIFYRDGLGPEVQLTNSPINQNVHDVSGRIVVYSDWTQPGFVRAIDLTTNTEIGVFGPRAAWPRIDGPHRRVCLTVTESREDQLFGEIQ